jgi:hypothetical protein
MKLSHTRLKEIIKEEITSHLAEGGESVDIALSESAIPEYQIRHLRRLIDDANGEASVWIKSGGEVKNIREIYVGKSGNLIIEVD